MQPHKGIISKTTFMEEKKENRGILKTQQLEIFHLHWIFRRADFSSFLAPWKSSKGSKEDVVLTLAAMVTIAAASKEEKLKLC